MAEADGQDRQDGGAAREEPPGAPTDASREAAENRREEEPHRDTGLDLARSIARGLASRPGRPRGDGGRGGAGRRRRGRRVDPQASGSHPDDRDPQTLDSTIGRFISQQGWEQDVRVHGVFSRWSAIVGEQVAQHAQPVSFRKDDETDGGRLVVQTDSTAWATQMRLLAPTVLRRLNVELGEGTVTFIEVRGPSAPTWSHGRRSVRGGRGPRDTYG